LQEKPRPSGRRAGLSYTCLYFGLLPEGSPVPSAPKTTRGAGIGFQKERPRRSGAKCTGDQLAEQKEGYFGLPQLDNSAIRSAGTQFLRQRACCQSVAVEQQVSFPNYG